MIDTKDANYHNKGRCPKCNHPAHYEPLAGQMPATIHCQVCGWREWDFKRIADWRKINGE